jgi:hypothetical protein
VRKIISRLEYKPTPPLGLGYFHRIIRSTQILTVAIILIIIFQMLFLNKYSLILLQVQTYLSHISALVFLSFLVFLFESWLLTSRKRNYVIILYTIGRIKYFSLMSIPLLYYTFLSKVTLEMYSFLYWSPLLFRIA